MVRVNNFTFHMMEMKEEIVVGWFNDDGKRHGEADFESVLERLHEKDPYAYLSVTSKLMEYKKYAKCIIKHFGDKQFVLYRGDGFNMKAAEKTLFEELLVRRFHSEETTNKFRKVFDSGKDIFKYLHDTVRIFGLEILGELDAIYNDVCIKTFISVLDEQREDSPLLPFTYWSILMAANGDDLYYKI